MAIEYIPVKEAKDRGIIPSLWHPFFSDTCIYCKKDLYINLPATFMKCNNPCCCRRVGNQIDSFLKDLGYKGFGPEKLTDYCRTNKIYSIVDFIEDPPPLYDFINDLNSRELTLSKLVELLHYPNLGTKAYKVFDGYSSYAELASDICNANDPIEFLAKKVGGYETALQVSEILYIYGEDIDYISKMVTLVKPVAKVIPIAITGHILEVSNNGHNVTKDEFVSCLNHYARPCNIEFRQSGALQSVSFIIADSVSNSRKYKIGAARGNLLSSGALLATVQRLYSEKFGGKLNE